MNKLVIVLLVAALVCAARAQSAQEAKRGPSPFSFPGSDADEIKYLDGDRKMFADFCLGARNQLLAYLKQNINNGAEAMFRAANGFIFDGIASASAQQRQAAAKGRELVRTDAGKVFEAMALAIKSIGDGFRSGLHDGLQQFQQLGGQLNRGFVREQILKHCDNLSGGLRQVMENLLAGAKEELMQEAPAEAQAIISETSLENVGCATTVRLNRLRQYCDRFREIPEETLNNLGKP